jgi:hypothetical protein
MTTTTDTRKSIKTIGSNSCGVIDITPNTPVVNVTEYQTDYDYRDGMKLFAICHVAGVRCLVFARCEQDAIDDAIDAGHFDNDQVSQEELDTMTEEEREELLCGGGASEYFYQDHLYIFWVEIPQFSLFRLYN